MNKSILKCIFLFSGIVLLSCCSIKSPNRTEIVELKLPFYDNDEHILNMSEFVDSIRYIHLETNPDNIIGEVGKVMCLDDKIIIVDDMFTHAVFFFDMQGKYLNKIAHRGSGPDEYVKIKSVSIDEKGKRVFILDTNQQRIVVYAFDGQYISSVKVDFSCFDIQYMENDVLACYCDYYTGNDLMVKNNQVPLIVLYNINDQEKKPYLYEDISIEGRETTMAYMLSKYVRDLASFTHPLSSCIYIIDSQQVKEGYLIDFGEKNERSKQAYVKLLKEENITAERIIKENLRPDYKMLTGSMLGDAFMSFGYRNFDKQINGMFFYDLKSGKMVGGQSVEKWPIHNDIDNGYPVIPYAVRDNHIFTVIDVGSISELNTTSSVLKQYQQTLTSDDNPIIMISTINIK